MRLLLISSLCMSLVVATQAVAESKPSSSDTAAVAGMEHVLVTGVQPGPGLWRVSKGNSTLWILGTYSPLPQKMTWRSQEVEATIAESNEVLAPYIAEFYVPGTDAYDLTGKKLRDVLEPSIYARWRTLQRRYMKRAGRDNWLPVSAAVQLQTRAFEHAGLSFDNQVWSTVYRIAKEHGVRINTEHQIRQAIRPSITNDLGGAVYYEPAAIEFLTRTIERLERDVAATKARANAWAVGDVTALTSLMEHEQAKAYMASLAGPFMADNGLDNIFQKADERWLRAASKALQTNDVTFAVLPVLLLTEPNGLLAKLGMMGYDVELPR